MRLAIVLVVSMIGLPRPHALGQDALGVPINAEIAVDEAAIGPHRTVDVVLTVTAEADLEQIRVRASATGNVEIVMPLDTSMPALRKNDVAVFGIPVRYGEPGESSVHFDIEAVITKVDFPFGDRATLNTIVRADRAFAGPDALVNLRREAAAYDRRVRRLRWVAIVAAAAGVVAALVVIRRRKPAANA